MMNHNIKRLANQNLTLKQIRSESEVNSDFEEKKSSNLGNIYGHMMLGRYGLKITIKDPWKTIRYSYIASS